MNTMQKLHWHQESVSISDKTSYSYMKVSKPRNLYLELYDRSGIWQAHRQCCRCACQISKRCDNSNYQSRSFGTSRDWNGGEGPISPMVSELMLQILKIQVTFILCVIVQSGRNFQQVKTARLLWSAQSCHFICSWLSKKRNRSWWCHKLSATFSYMYKIPNERILLSFKERHEKHLTLECEDKVGSYFIRATEMNI